MWYIRIYTEYTVLLPTCVKDKYTAYNVPYSKTYGSASALQEYVYIITYTNHQMAAVRNQKSLNKILPNKPRFLIENNTKTLHKVRCECSTSASEVMSPWLEGVSSFPLPVALLPLLRPEETTLRGSVGFIVLVALRFCPGCRERSVWENTFQLGVEERHQAAARLSNLRVRLLRRRAFTF